MTKHPVDYYSDIDHNLFEKISEQVSAGVPENQLDIDLPNYSLIPQKSWAYIEKDASGEYVKRFPIDSKTSAIMSKFYLGANKESMDPALYNKTAAVIDAALDAMDAGKDVAFESKKPAETDIEKEASDRSWKNVVLDGVEGSDKDGVIGSMRKFANYSEHLGPKESFGVAKRIIKRAGDFNISISKSSPLYAYKMVDEKILNKNASIVIKMRKDYYSDDLNKLASELLNSLDTLTPLEAANALHEMDKTAGIVDYYKKDVPDPYTSMFGSAQWGWVTRHKNSSLVKEAESKLSVYFNEDIVKLASEDVMKAYKSLGPQGRGVFRKILDKINFNEKA